MDTNTTERLAQVEAIARSLHTLLGDLLRVADQVVPDHVATDPDHAYGRLVDRAEAYLLEVEGVLS